MAALLLLSACQSQPGRPDARPVGTTTDVAGCDAATPANDAFLATLWQQTAAEYRALSLQVYVRAEAALARALADPDWNALDPAERPAAPATDRIALIADIDETLLDNSGFAVREMRRAAAACSDQGKPSSDQGEPDFQQRWQEWVVDRQAPALAGAAQFFRQAAEQPKVQVFYITNRLDAEKEVTCLNLTRVGFPVFDCQAQVLTRNDQDGRGKDKVSRRMQIGRLYRVALLFGDNLGDFAGNVLSTPTERAALVEAHRDWWGERWFMLPNPLYGSWLEVQSRIDNEPSLSGSERQHQIRAMQEKSLKDCLDLDCLDAER